MHGSNWGSPSWNSLVTQRVSFLTSILSCFHTLGSLTLLLQLAHSNNFISQSTLLMSSSIPLFDKLNSNNYNTWNGDMEA